MIKINNRNIVCMYLVRNKSMAFFGKLSRNNRIFGFDDIIAH